jgi:AcrR family transcriptional regulator
VYDTSKTKVPKTVTNQNLTGRQRSNKKTEQILQGATTVFLRRGYSDASMDKIAAAAGVSKQTLYGHFSDKKDLFTTLVDRMSRKQLATNFGEKSLEGDPKEVLRQLAVQSLSQLMADESYHDFVRLMVAESKQFPDLVEGFMRNVTRPSIEKLSRFLADSPALEIADPEATAHILLGTVVFFMLTQAVMPGKFVIPMSQDRFVAALIDLI